MGGVAGSHEGRTSIVAAAASGPRGSLFGVQVVAGRAFPVIP